MRRVVARFMMAPAALLHAMVASLTFGVITYSYTGRWITAVGFAIACHALIQVGYFLGMVYLVLRKR